MDVWQRGTLHIVRSMSATGHTRMRVEPPVPFQDDDGVMLVLSYVGDLEHVYERLRSATKDGTCVETLRQYYNILSESRSEAGSYEGHCTESVLAGLSGRVLDEEQRSAFLKVGSSSNRLHLVDGVCEARVSG